MARARLPVVPQCRMVVAEGASGAESRDEDGHIVPEIGLAWPVSRLPEASTWMSLPPRSENSPSTRQEREGDAEDQEPT